MIDLPGEGDVELEVDGRALRLTTLDRLLFPEPGLTKADVLRYYAAVAPALLPHLAGRPCTLGRFPEGVDRYGWYQTHCRAAPPWIRTFEVRNERYCILDDLPALLWAANIGAIELHPFLALSARPDEPTALVFDLDPGPPATILDCRDVATALREVLGGLESYPKTSGSLGLHVYVPLALNHTFDQTKAFARQAARRLAQRYPAGVVDRQRRELRSGRVLVDWGQNDASKSLVAPYSLRAYSYPTVSTPLSWEELERARTPDDLLFGAAEALDRLGRQGDLFAPVLERAGRLTDS